MKRSGVYTAILLILVLIIAVLGFLILRRKAPAAQPEPTPDAAATATPLPGEDSPATPAPTEPPVPTEEPVFETRPPVETDAPEETPAPTPTPVPDAMGSFTSNTGTGLNIRVDWSTLPGGDQLRLDVFCVSYSIYTSAQWHGVALNLAGQTYAADTAAVSYDGQDQRTSLLASFTVDAPPSGSAASVTWHYKGSYSGKELDEITASGSIHY